VFYLGEQLEEGLRLGGGEVGEPVEHLLLVGGRPVAPVALAFCRGAQPADPRVGLVGADLQESLPLQGVRQLPGILVGGPERGPGLAEAGGVLAGEPEAVSVRLAHRCSSQSMQTSDTPHVTCVYPLVAAFLSSDPRPEPHVSDMSQTQNPIMPGLMQNGLKITAQLRRHGTGHVTVMFMTCAVLDDMAPKAWIGGSY
jgi:hypothetical protein